MNSITIPSILAGVILVAGIFAFMPIDQASTVHTTIQASTTQMSIATDTKTVTDTGTVFRVTCPAGSAGCHILEMYIRDNDGGADLDVALIQLRMNGETFTIAADGANTTVGADATALVNGVSGLAITASDIITVNLDGNSDTYTLTVVSQTEGDSEITIT